MKEFANDDVADSAARHPIVQAGARLGFVVSGLLNALIGFLAIRVALGDGSAAADQSGALASLAASPLGWALLVASVVGLGLLAFHSFAQLLRNDPEQSKPEGAG